MNKEMNDMITNILYEGLSEPYEKAEDKTVPNMGDKRKPVLTMKKINALKKVRASKREELAMNSTFIPYLYGPAEQQAEGGDMGGGMPF